MKNGFISKNTWDADRIMVISHNPVVLGGMPGKDEEDNHEMVAFLGQVPTMVLGEVNPGDYILPSGMADGTGIAKRPEHMSPEDYEQILGVAWEGSNGRSFNMINVAIGLNTNDISDVVIQQEEVINAQQEEIEKLQGQMAILADLVPGFREAAGIEGEYLATATDHSQHDHKDEIPVVTSIKELNPAEIGHNEIVMIELTKEHYEEGLKMAREQFIESGGNVETHPFWIKMSTDESYNESIYQKVKSKFDKTLHYHRDINERIGKE